MKPIDYRKADRLLVSHGWFAAHGKGSHVTYRKDGVREAITLTRHPGNLSIGVQMQMMRIAGISRDEL